MAVSGSKYEVDLVPAYLVKPFEDFECLNHVSFASLLQDGEVEFGQHGLVRQLSQCKQQFGGPPLYLFQPTYIPPGVRRPCLKG